MKKYIAQIIIETTTPLVVGSGKSSLDNDAIVARDWNFLPYVPGTGILGVLRSLFSQRYDENSVFSVFGGKDKDTKKEGTFKGAVFEISDALLIDGDDYGKNGTVLQNIVCKSDLSNYHKSFLKLPKREHAKIGFTGVVEDTGKFDNEFVYKGARFKFEIELQDDNEITAVYWKSILDFFSSSDFLLGSGTTNGYGQIKVVSVKEKTYDLNKENELIAYLNHSVDLNADFDGEEHIFKSNESNWEDLSIENINSNALHIGAGYGDSDVDDTNYREQVIEWNSNKANWKEYYVIPGSSIKGVIAHRVAYLFNKEKGNTIEKILNNGKTKVFDKEQEKIDNLLDRFNKKIEAIKNYNDDISIDELNEKLSELDKLKNEINDFEYASDKLINGTDLLKDYVGENNEMVKQLFGFASNNDENGTIGKIIFNDVYIPSANVAETIFMHNKIDRFTGGTIDTALYEEKVFVAKEPLTINYKIYKNSVSKELTGAIKDLTKGNLAIGGKTNKGYGYFTKKTQQDDTRKF